MPHEFRVRWERDGRNPATRIYQSWDAACKKARGVQAMDDIKGETTKFADLPDLVGPPVLQVREVGEWRAHDYQPKAHDSDRDGMREFARDYGPIGAVDLSEGSPF